MTAASPQSRNDMLTKDSPSEHTRLRSIQSSTDAFSTGILGGLGIAGDWSCLELGAGAGSIAYWLAERCPDGRVLAVDRDTRLLEPGPPNLELRRADVTDPQFQPGRFDLVHARFLCCHLDGRDELIARAAEEWLAPDGWLVVADPYQLPAADAPVPLLRRLLAAYTAAYAENGADLSWARRLPALLAGAGLTDIEFTGRLGCLGNGGRDRWRPLIAQAAPRMLAAGGITQDDLDEFDRLLADPAFVDIPQFTLAAWGRRPA